MSTSHPAIVARPADRSEALTVTDEPRDEHWYDNGGVPRFLDSTWAVMGGKPSDPREQARLGWEYIKSRYGSLPPGMTVVINDSGEDEPVITPEDPDDPEPDA